MNVLLFQLDILFGHPKQNLQHILTELNKQQLDEIDLVVLPELFLTGYHQESIHHVAHNLDAFLEPLHKLIQDFDFMMYGSLPEYANKQYYNTAVLLGKNGVLATYRKSHLFAPMGETELFSSGRQIVTYQTNGNHFGFSICYDLRFPELYNELGKAGANIFLLAAEWPVSRINHWRLLVQARAVEQQSYIIAVNRSGNDPNYIYGGHSMVVDPYGEIMLEFSAGEEIKSATIDNSRVSDFKAIFDVQDFKWI